MTAGTGSSRPTMKTAQAAKIPKVSSKVRGCRAAAQSREAIHGLRTSEESINSGSFLQAGTPWTVGGAGSLPSPLPECHFLSISHHPVCLLKL
jgi:hypothetical protein